jgi:hypothetical protein
MLDMLFYILFPGVHFDKGDILPSRGDGPDSNLGDASQSWVSGKDEMMYQELRERFVNLFMVFLMGTINMNCRSLIIRVKI